MNKFEQRSKNSYNKKAQNYDSTFDGKFTVKFKKMLCKYINISPGSTVADVACGNGRLLHSLAKKNMFSGYGVDISDKMIEQAKKLNPDMHFYVSACDKLPFKQGEIDIMTVCAAFHHFPDVRGFAKEAARVVKTGGSLYIADVYLPKALRVLVNPFIRFSKSGDVKIYAPEEIAAIFGKYGFYADKIKIDGGIQMIKLRR